jgi:hypothetical protein
MVERGKTWSEASLEFRDAIEVFKVPLEPKFYNAFKNDVREIGRYKLTSFGGLPGLRRGTTIAVFQ